MVASARRGFLATADAYGQPHLVPVVFVVQGRRLFIPLDTKPKRVNPLDLKRVRNIRANPRVAFLVDHWDEDWERLAYVLLLGHASLQTQGEDYSAAVTALQDKYPQYRHLPLGTPPLIAVEVTRAIGWGNLETFAPPAEPAAGSR